MASARLPRRVTRLARRAIPGALEPEEAQPDLPPAIEAAMQTLRRWQFQRWCETRPRELRLGARVRIVGHRGRLRVGENVHLATGVRLALCNPSAVIEIGDRVLINWNTKLVAMQRISIGAGSAISWNVSIMDTDLHLIDESEPNAPVEIEERVLVCAHAVILKGVRVGEGAVVAAGSVVTRDVAPRTLVAGAPATVQRENISWR